METHAQIIERLGAPRIAAALSVHYETVKKWKQRGRIPDSYWLDLVDWAASINRRVSFEGLALAAKAARDKAKR